MNNMIFYLIGFFIVVYVARMMGEKATKKYLNSEQKAGLIDHFAKERKFGSAMVLLLIIAFFAVLQFQLVNVLVAFGSYFVIMMGYMVFKSYNTYKKLSAHQYPPEFIKQVVLANIIAALGMFAFFALIMFDVFFHK